LSDRSDTRGGLQSIENIAKRVVDAQLAGLNKDVAPYVIRITRTLEKDPNKDVQKQQLDPLEKEVKAGNYKVALDSYLKLYESTKSVAAAINASIMYEATGEAQAGADLLQRVVSETGNPKANIALGRIQKELGETAKVEDFAEQKSKSPAERVAEVALEEMQSVFPEEAKVLLVNNAARDALVSDVIDNVTSALIKQGVTVIDRQNTALIQAEQQFQMSGNVSDEDIVSIGNMAGGNVVIMFSISGSASKRRLQLRVLDVQRGTLLMQTDTSDKWSL
jgi:hypothetical protein